MQAEFVLATRKNEFDGTSLISQEVPANLLATPPILNPIPANFIGQPINVAGVQNVMLYMNGANNMEHWFYKGLVSLQAEGPSPTDPVNFVAMFAGSTFLVHRRERK